MNNSSNYIKLELNQPTTISLRYIPGKPVTDGWNRAQTMWITSEGKALYTPVTVGEQLTVLGIKAGQKFTITKGTQPGSNRVQWSVSKLPADAAPNRAEVDQATGSRSAGSMPQRAAIPVRRETNQPQPAVKLLDSEASLNDPFLDDPRPPAKPAQSIRANPPTQLEHALKTAVAAAAAAEKEGERLGYAVRFNSGDIRAMGISVLISMGNRHAA